MVPEVRKLPEVRRENTDNMKNVEELLKILSIASMIREEQQISILLDQMRRMEENQLAMMQELADVKQQLNAALDKIENELESAKGHIKDAGRIAVGKEPAIPKEESKKRHKLLSPLGIYKSACARHYEKYKQRAEKLDRAIEKFNSLDQRASVLGKLSEQKEKIDSGKENPAQEKSIEHKKDENVR